MISDKKLNLIVGWFCFLISFTVYFFTTEPTVGFWDTGEYITTSAKLQVGHPPGAPLYQMLGAIFSVFAIEKENIGFTMNLMSGFSSALTIAFLYWSIVLLLKKFTSKLENSFVKQLSISSAGVIGSLSFAFTDTFWFNAVEAEVYAMATLIMSVLFYLGLRWEAEMDQPRGNKWLLLICFVIGLSFGVHFMGLLVIPALVMIYYFKNHKEIIEKFKLNPIVGFIVANIIGVGVLMGVFKLLLPNTLKFFSTLEIFFVNTLNLPFNSGTLAAFVILFLVFYMSISYTKRKGLIKANTITLCFLFIFIGFSSWLILPIRANADVVVNENDPSNARELLAYYNLEQYPKTYFFYGPLFTDYFSGLDKEKPYKDGNPKYERDLIKNKYVIVNDYKNAIPNYNSKHGSILPRMWSTQPDNVINYFEYSNFLDFDLKEEFKKEKYYGNENISEIKSLIGKVKNRIKNDEIGHQEFFNFLIENIEYVDIEKPSLLDNLYYMFDYQIGYMYWRYFMWNFAGRQDDIQGEGNSHGNWLSGINFIDEWNLGLSQENLPTDVLENKSRNTYYLLPLFLGLLGLFFLFQTNKEYFWILLLFFVFTGIAIQVYTNVRPFEPRERDYSVVGSFYVFSIVIGLGSYFVTKMFEKIKLKGSLVLSFLLCFKLVPANLILNNWDDHDRSDRYTAYAMAVNYLESCDENAILFTIGDNDTFPLWYAQEIEGIRTDVRVVNTSLLNTDWYINQMKRKAYDSDPIPSSLSKDKYSHGTRDLTRYEIILSNHEFAYENFMNLFMSQFNYSDQYFEVEKVRPRKDTLDIREFIKNITSDDLKNKRSYVLKLRAKEELKDSLLNKMVEKKYFDTIDDLQLNFEDLKSYATDLITNQMQQYGQAVPDKKELEDIVARVMSNKDEIKRLEDQYLQENAMQKTIYSMLKDEIKIKSVLDNKTNELFESYWEKYKKDNKLRSQDLNENIFYNRHVSIPVNKKNVLKHGIVSEKSSDKIENEIYINFDVGGFQKNRLIMLDIIAENDWERPIYFSGGAYANEDYIWLKDYLQHDGMVYKLVPVKTPAKDKYTFGMIDTEKMMSKLKKWKWGYDDPSEIYLDDQSRKNSISYRIYFNKLVEQLIIEDKLIEAEKVLDMCMEMMPVDEFGFYSFLEPFVDSYFKVNKPDKAKKLFDHVVDKYQDKLNYFSTLSEENKMKLYEDSYYDFEIYKTFVQTIIKHTEEDDFDFLQKRYNEFEYYQNMFD